MTMRGDPATDVAAGQGAMPRSGLGLPFIAIGSVLLVLVCLFPFAWMALSSVKPLSELYTVPPTWIPQNFSLDNYRTVLFNSNIPRYFLNSVVISLGATAISIVLAALTAYGFARFNFRGRNAMQASILISQLLPTATIIVPLYVLLSRFGLVNTYLGLILVYLIHTLPLYVWLLINYFRAIPYEIEEAALVDGCTRLQALWKVVFPLAAPGIFTASILVFIFAWNEFFFALIVLTSPGLQTLPVGIALFPGEYTMPWGEIAAATTIATLPLIGLTLLFQRRIIRGLSAGAVKG